MKIRGRLTLVEIRFLTVFLLLNMKTYGKWWAIGSICLKTMIVKTIWMTSFMMAFPLWSMKTSVKWWVISAICLITRIANAIWMKTLRMAFLLANMKTSVKLWVISAISMMTMIVNTIWMAFLLVNMKRCVQALAEDCGAHATEYFGGLWKFKNY